jgi:diacylglycerol kinase family enzyme
MWLQIGGTGDTITQASKVRIVTAAPLPFQVDGEACTLDPCEIVIEHRAQAAVILGPQKDA